MLSIKENVSNEIVTNKSRFITCIYRIDDEKIDNHLNDIKRKYKDATHYCYAYIINNTKRFNDDGEPSGTAGKPILDVLEKNNLNHILCIVVRYFGGIKLGAGGLVRAYSNSASNCINKADIVELVKGKRIEIAFDYDKQKEIDYLLREYKIINKEYDDKIKYIINVDDTMLEKLREISIKIIKDVLIEKIPN